MAVLVEGISVIIPIEHLQKSYPGGLSAFEKNAPNKTLCSDGEIVRIGFMAPPDVQAFVLSLERYGLRYLDGQRAVDIAVVDQQRGPMSDCEWLKFMKYPVQDQTTTAHVSACRLKDGKAEGFAVPRGWAYENSLSKSFGFTLTEHAHKGMTFLYRKDGMDVFYDELAEAEVFIARPDLSE